MRMSRLATVLLILCGQAGAGFGFIKTEGFCAEAMDYIVTFFGSVKVEVVFWIGLEHN